MNIFQKLKNILAQHLGLSDEWQDGTYLYYLTRTKSAFGLGTMTMDDFVEVDEELLEEIYEDIKPLFEEQEEKISKMEKYLLNTSSKMDQLHEYLQENHDGSNWGKHIIDAAIDIMKDQQKEIELLTKSCEEWQEIYLDARKKLESSLLKNRSLNHELKSQDRKIF